MQILNMGTKDILKKTQTFPTVKDQSQREIEAFWGLEWSWVMRWALSHVETVQMCPKPRPIQYRMKGWKKVSVSWKREQLFLKSDQQYSLTTAPPLGKHGVLQPLVWSLRWVTLNSNAHNIPVDNSYLLVNNQSVKSMHSSSKTFFFLQLYVVSNIIFSSKNMRGLDLADLVACYRHVRKINVPANMCYTPSSFPIQIIKQSACKGSSGDFSNLQ